ncbi:MFS transporter [Planctomonas sp. JC2975]|uniref:MFS transporter n=1 Tax=Planctomonas sp. JC2975 TaxID=2729626 RepID=UPI001475542D|nr:MFS transporter [Planctomonas sp. JC2975]NNC10969.1 MFS transporter [Planctomonas sp. JC2975]
MTETLDAAPSANPTQPLSSTADATAARHTAAIGASLTQRSGRWIDGWNPEDAIQWAAQGRAIARRNLGWSIFAEFLGFVVWQLWSIVVVLLPGAGFHLSTSESFWLISLPSLVGATLRIPYSFMVPLFGGRNWTIVSAALLLVPTIGLALAVGNPATPFWVLLTVAGLAGFGGGNFASSMSNITFFFPQREKGWALGLNAAGGNLGAAVAQLAVPVVVALTAGAGLGLGIAGWMWVPLIVVAMVGAWRGMNNLANAKTDFAASASAIREPHLWLLALLYIGTFGSFIGFAGVFPKLIADQFPAFATIPIGPAAISLAFLGALVGSLARPYGGRLADRFGGAAIAALSFAAMGVVALAVVLALPIGSFWLFLAFFLVLFVASGIGNGATYRMIPTIFLVASGASGPDDRAAQDAQRRSAAALGIISAIGAYGGFLIPQVLNLSFTATGGYESAFLWFVACYAVLFVVTLAVYLKPRGRLAGHRI